MESGPKIEYASAVDVDCGSFAVDAGGQATYSVPVPVPPGIRGFQPELSLVYSHRLGNDSLGVGWRLGGQSAISRVRATYAQDGVSLPITFGPSDRYALDGQRLVNTQGEYGSSQAIYMTEVQSWVLVQAGASALDGFVAKHPNGEQWAYGTTSDSRVLTSDGVHVRVWLLASKTDLHGNRIEYTYLQPGLLGSAGSPSGAAYLQTIAYGIHGSSEADRTVTFAWETRPDPIVDFVGGSSIATEYRLKSIVTAIEGDPAVLTVSLAYDVSPATGVSRIVSVGKMGSSLAGFPQLPPLAFEWQGDPVNALVTGPQSTFANYSMLVGQPLAMDVTGSGTMDMVQVWSDGTQLWATPYLAQLVHAEQDGPAFVAAPDCLLGPYSASSLFLPADVDGDGRTDLVVIYTNDDGTAHFALFQSNGAGFGTAVDFPSGAPADNSQIGFYALDVNGDGRSDIVQTFADTNECLGFRIYLSNMTSAGGSYLPALLCSTGDPAQADQQLFWPMDVNGDGLIDLVRVFVDGNQNLIAAAYIAQSTSLDQVALQPGPHSSLGPVPTGEQVAFLPVDANGDGIFDLLQVWQEQTANGTTLHLTTHLCNAAGSFDTLQDSAFPNAPASAGGILTLGFTGGNIPTILSQWTMEDGQSAFDVYTGSAAGVFRYRSTMETGIVESAGTAAQWSVPGDTWGAGKASLVFSAGNDSQSLSLTPFQCAGAYPDLIAAIAEPLGCVTFIQYAPLTDPGVYTQSSLPAFPAAAASRPTTCLSPMNFPVQAVLGESIYVVSSYAETSVTLDPFPFQRGYSYSYANAAIDLLGRGWQGFQSVTRLNLSNGRAGVHRYLQAFPYTGSLDTTRIEANGQYATDPRVPKDQSNLLLSLARQTYTLREVLKRPDGTHDPLVVLRTRFQQEQYNYGEANFDFAVAETFAYDSYGRLLTHARLGLVDRVSGDPLAPSAVVYRHFENWNVTAGPWLLGLVVGAKITTNDSIGDSRTFQPGDLALELRTYGGPAFDQLSRCCWDDRTACFLQELFTYDAFGNVASQALPGGATFSFRYEDRFNTYVDTVTTPATPSGAVLVTRVGYDPRFGTEVAKADWNGEVFVVAFDGFGRPVTSQGPAADSLAGTSDASQLISLVTGSPQSVQIFQAATLVTLATRGYVDGGPGLRYREDQTLQEFPTDSTRVFLWSRSFVDGLGRQTFELMQSGQTAGDIASSVVYDAEDRPIRESTPCFTGSASSAEWVETTYDVIGRPLQRVEPTWPGTTRTTWLYAAGLKTTTTHAADSPVPFVQQVTQTIVDGRALVASVCVVSQGNATTTYAYDVLGRSLHVTDPATQANPSGVTNSLTYDSLGRRLTLDNPDQNTTGAQGVVALSLFYDAVTGNCTRKMDAAGDSSLAHYDALGRLAQETLPDGRTVNYGWDDPSARSLGRIASVTTLGSDGSVESGEAFTYDAYGNVASTTLTIAGETKPFVTGTLFDPQGRITQRALPDGTLETQTYSYGRCVAAALDGAAVQYELDAYSPTGRPGSMSYGLDAATPPITGAFAYSPSGLLKQAAWKTRSAAVDRSYSYTDLKQLATVLDVPTGAPVASYTYDGHRLVSAQALPQQETFTYNADGSLATKDELAFGYSAHFANLIRNGPTVVQSATPDACGRTQERTANGVTYRFVYDGRGCLAAVTTKEGQAVTSVLSTAAGRRLKQTSGDTVVLYIHDSMQISMCGGQTEILKTLSGARGVVATIRTNVTSGTRTIRYVWTDPKGSATAIFDETGLPVDSIVYDAYGANTQTGEAEDAHLFEGTSWDSQLGLYYFGQRYYDPVACQFLTPDVSLGGASPFVPGVFQRYAFELGDPINHRDPSGDMAEWIAGMIVGAALVGAGIAIVASGGAATPLAVAGVGALIGGGIGGMAYSAQNKSVTGTRFLTGYLAYTAVGAGAGAVLGYGAGAAMAGSSTALAAGETAVASSTEAAAAESAASAGGGSFGSTLTSAFGSWGATGLAAGVAATASVGLEVAGEDLAVFPHVYPGTDTAVATGRRFIQRYGRQRELALVAHGNRQSQTISWLTRMPNRGRLFRDRRLNAGRFSLVLLRAALAGGIYDLRQRYDYITLFACHLGYGGADSFAQRLANILQINVVAATDRVRASNGEVRDGEPYEGDGWVMFTPNQRPNWMRRGPRA